MTSRFIDVYLDPCVPGYPAYSSPRWSTDIAIVDSGDEQVNQRWANPLNRYTIPDGVRDMATFNAVRDHWLVMRGPAKVWPWRDPIDFASLPLTAPMTAPAITGTDQILGTGDGVTRDFQIVKLYARGAQQYSRKITLPIVSSLILKVDGVLQTTGFSVSRPGGVIHFDVAPVAGKLITAGYLFDVPVRFESDDSFDGITHTFGVGAFANLVFLEVRNC